MLWYALSNILFFLIPIIVIVYFFKHKKAEGDDLEEIIFPRYLVWTLFLAVLGYNLFIFETDVGIGYGLFNLFLMGGLLISFPKEKRTPFVYFLAAISVFAGLFLGIRANDFVHQVNVVAMWIVFVTLLGLYAVDDITWDKGWIFKYVIRYGITGLKRVVALLRFSSKEKDSKKGIVIRVLKTTIITAVVLFFFVGLLSNADPVFGKIIDGFYDEIITRTISSIGIAVVLLWLLIIRFRHQEGDGRKFLSFYDVFIPGVVLSVLFAFFLFIQGKYLFGSRDAFAAFDMTYSDYVRKGFTELLMTSLLGGVLVYTFFVKQQSLESSRQMFKLRTVNVALLVELILMLFSALQRNLLYIEIFGWSRVRFIGMIFLGWLAGVMLLLLLINLWKKAKERELFVGITAFSMVVIVLLNGLNIDQIIAKSAPPKGRYKDIYYTSVLSPDAVDEWRDAIFKAQAVFGKYYQDPSVRYDAKKTNEFLEAQLAISAIAGRARALNEKYADESFVLQKYYPDNWMKKDYGIFYTDYSLVRKRKWQAYNFSEHAAFRIITKESDVFLDEVDCLMEEFKNYYLINKYNFGNEIYKRMHDFKNQFISYQPYFYIVDLTTYNYDTQVYKDVLPSHPPRACAMN
ncbi:MAG: DUF4173 domain-containing protein [Patescibacteria group bacterium]